MTSLADFRQQTLRKIKLAPTTQAMVDAELRPSAALWSTILTWTGPNMPESNIELDQMQTAYKTAVEQWIDAIKQEEALASVNHTVAEVDKWENAHFKEEEIRNRVKTAKEKYETALREKFFGF
jgi:hypothetical protein